MASGGEVSIPCREMIDLSHYTFLYVCVYLDRAMPDYAQRKSWLAEHGIEVEGV